MLIDTTEYRREKQAAYNEEHGIVPQQIRKEVYDSLRKEQEEAREINASIAAETPENYGTNDVIADLEREMLEAAEAMEFERAMMLRDQVYELKESMGIKVDKPQTKKQQKTKGRVRYTVKKRDSEK